MFHFIMPAQGTIKTNFVHIMEGPYPLCAPHFLFLKKHGFRDKLQLPSSLFFTFSFGSSITNDCINPGLPVRQNKLHKFGYPTTSTD